MNKELTEAWQRACSTPGEPIDIGRLVECDSCGKDYTDSDACGGFVFYSKAICPDCATEWMHAITSHGEQSMIRATCRDGQAFADFIREYRGQDTHICVGPLPRRGVLR